MPHGQVGIVSRVQRRQSRPEVKSGNKQHVCVWNLVLRLDETLVRSKDTSHGQESEPLNLSFPNYC